MRGAREEGFGLIELLAAMTVLAIAVGALLTAFSSSFIALRRGAVRGTATVLAERQIELYRKLAWYEIRIDGDQLASAPAPYLTASSTDTWFPTDPLTQVKDGAYSGDPPLTIDCAEPPNPVLEPECQPVQYVVGPDRHRYRVDTYIQAESYTAPIRTVWVAVYELKADGITLSTDAEGNVRPPAARASSSFASFDYVTG